MKKFIGQALGGKFTMGEDAPRFKEFLQRNDGLRMEVIPMLPESRKMRKYYFGAVLQLWAYCDGKDYKDDAVIEKMHEVAKLEFNPGMINVNGKVYKIPQSTKGRKLRIVIDRIIDYLEENYAIDRTKVLNPSEYKLWQDTIFPYGGPEFFIDYLVETKALYDRNTTG